MRYVIRGLSLLTLGAAMWAVPSRAAAAAPVDSGSVWVAPSRLDVPLLRYDDFKGDVYAYRAGVGPGTTVVCVAFTKTTAQRDGSTRYDSIFGCEDQPDLSAYSFAPARWRGAVRAQVRIGRWSLVEQANGTISQTEPTAFGVASVNLGWTGVGDPTIRRSTAVYFLTPYVDVAVTKRAVVNGTVAFGTDVVRVANASGAMETA